MVAITTDLLTVAKKVNNYALDATTPTAYWLSTTNYVAVCPTGKRWHLLSGNVYRAVSSTLEVTVKNVADKVIHYLDYAAATTGNSGYPDSTFCGGATIVVDAGEYIDAGFGTAQNASSFCTCVVLEVDI